MFFIHYVAINTFKKNTKPHVIDFEFELPLNLNFQPGDLKVRPLEQVLKRAQLVSSLSTI